MGTNLIPIYIVAGLAVVFGFLLVLLEFIGRNTHHDNVDLYPPPGPPRPDPAPKVVHFPAVQPLPPAISENLDRVLKQACTHPGMHFSDTVCPKCGNLVGDSRPPRPAPGKTITFAPWMTEEQKQRIIANWRKENFE